MILKGYIEIDEYGCLLLNDSVSTEPYMFRGYFLERLQEKFAPRDKVAINYFITSKPTTLEQAKKAHITRVVGGPVDELAFALDAWSEYTILEYEESLVIGGHDLFSELSSWPGKYLIFSINKVE